jgi:hypothetical protein
VDWPEALEEMEERLAAAERTLSLGTPPPGTFEEPTEAGPLPPELRERAVGILTATRRLEWRVRAARDRLAQARLRSVAPERKPSAYVDARG